MLRSGRSSNESGSDQADLLKNQYPPRSDYIAADDDQKGHVPHVSNNPPLYVGGHGDQMSLGMGSADEQPPPQYRRPRYPCFPRRDRDGYGGPEGEHPNFLNPGGGLHYSYVLVMALLFSTIVQLSRGGLLAYEQKKHNESHPVDPIYSHGFANIRGSNAGGVGNDSGNTMGMNGGYYGWGNPNNNNMMNMQGMRAGGNNLMGQNQMNPNNGVANNMMMQGNNNGMMAPATNQNQFSMMNQNNNMMTPMNPGMMNQNQNGFMNGNGMGMQQNNLNMMQQGGQMMIPQGQGQQDNQQNNNMMAMMQQQQDQQNQAQGGGTMMFPEGGDATDNSPTTPVETQDGATTQEESQPIPPEQVVEAPQEVAEPGEMVESPPDPIPVEDPVPAAEEETPMETETPPEVEISSDDPLPALINFKDAWEPWEPSDVPVFFHIPKSGGSTIKDVMGTCHRFVMASEAGVTDGHIDDTEVAVVYPRVGVPGAALSPFVNVDTTTVAGIERAKNMGFADSGLGDAVVTPFIYESNELFTQTAQGRLFCVFRHPIDRAISLFYYLQVAEWEPTYDPDLKNWSIEQYATSSKIENNWLTRQLSNQLGGELTDEHVNLAMEVIRRKFLVGLMGEMKETMTRLERFFHWTYRVNPANQEICREDLLSGGSNSNSKNKKDKPEPGSEAWDLLAAQNQYDLQVYGYIENLFKEQEQFFADVPEDIRNIGATCCKCDPPTFPEEGFECPQAITDDS